MAKDNTQPDDHTNNTEHTDHTNNTDHTETAEASGAVPYEDGTEHGSVGDETTTEEAPASGTRPGGVFSAETFGLTALLLLAMTLLSGQLLEIFTNVLFIDGNPVPVEQVDQFSTQIVVRGSGRDQRAHLGTGTGALRRRYPPVGALGEYRHIHRRSAARDHCGVVLHHASRGRGTADAEFPAIGPEDARLVPRMRSMISRWRR